MLNFHRTIAAATIAALAFLAPMSSTVSAQAAAPVRVPETATYIVKSGDSIIGVARTLKVTVSDLLAANNLTLSSVIYPGMRLSVPTAGSAGEYVIAVGDSIFGIASRLRVSVKDLMSASGLDLGSKIHPGMRIKVPAGSVLAVTSPTSPGSTSSPSSPVKNPTGLTYEVKRGDYLSRIAARYGVTLRQLLDANQLSATSLILPGRTLSMPANAVAPAPTPSADGPSSGTGASAISGTATKIERVLAFALDQRGKPYRFFTAGPDSFDCSGLTKQAYAQVGVALVHYSGAQATAGGAVDWTREQILPGDLVFTYSGSSTDVIGHVGIAVTSTTWVHAPGTNDVVRVSSIPTSRILSVRRMIEP